MTRYFEQLRREIERNYPEKVGRGKFYSIVKDYFDKVEKYLDRKEMVPKVCFEIKDCGEEKVRSILSEKNIPFELNPLGESSSLLKIFS